MSDGRFNLKFREDPDLHLDFGNSQQISTTNYEDLYNKPSIEWHELNGNSTLPQIGVNTATTQEIEAILYLG